MNQISTTSAMDYKLTSYLQYQGINKAILDFFKVKVENEGTKDLAIHYPYLDGSVKTCRPYSEKKWFRSTPTQYPNLQCVFGFNQLPEKGEIVVIAAGEKDTMSLQAIGLPAICFNSETATVDKRVLDSLRRRFEEVVILFDCDETGIQRSLRLSDECKLPYGLLPMGKYGKDVTDYLSSIGTKSDVAKILERGKSKFYRRVMSYPASMLNKMKFSEEDYLIPDILPSDSLCALVGGSDLGKSLLALQFAISYVIERDFVGLKISGGKKALYFSLEDSQGSIAGRFEKLISDFTKEEVNRINSNLFFNHTKEEINESIKKHLSDHPDTGLIIIDTFSELAVGRDINSSGEVRDILRPLHQICLQNQTAILIIHHIGKSSEKEGGFNKLGIVGSQSFEATMRVVFELVKPGKGQLSLGIVKGNYIAENLKSGRLRTYLQHSSETLWFSKNMESGSFESESIDKCMIDWSLIFGKDKTLSTSEIRSRLSKNYSIKEKTAEKRIGNELGDFRIRTGVYKNPTSPDNQEEEEFFQL